MNEPNLPTKMDPTDPSTQEVHDLKRRASERCGHDFGRILEEIRRIQQGRAVVPAPDAGRREDAA